MQKWLRWSAAGVCLGLALRTWHYGFPLRVLLWDEQWWGGFAQLMGYPWATWVTDPRVDATIELLPRVLGVLLFVAGLVLLWGRRLRWAAITAFSILLLQHFLTWKDHFWQLGQALELCLQTGAPLLLLGVKYAPGAATSPTLAWWMRGLTAATFIGHGLYAAGFHPVPAHFVLMTQAGLGITEPLARQFLTGVGILDFLAAALLLLPDQRAVRVALCWMIPWAILTSLARLWSYEGLVTGTTLWQQWLPEVIRRLPHVGIPIALWYTVSTTRRNEPTKSTGQGQERTS